MPRGGARPGAGRKKGSKTALTREPADKLAKAGGVMPLDVMIETMRELWDGGKKLEACAIAEKAAPYMHPRLSAVDHSGEITTNKVIRAPAISSTPQEWIEQHVPKHMTEH